MSNLNKYRLDLAEDELKILRYILTNETNELEFESSDIYKSLIEKSTKPKIIKPSVKRIKNAQINRKKRSTAAEKKIYKAIETLKKDNKSITAYSVAKQAKVAYNTAKKYIKQKSSTKMPKAKMIDFEKLKTQQTKLGFKPTIPTLKLATTEPSEITVVYVTPEMLETPHKNQQEQETNLTIEPIAAVTEAEVKTVEQIEPKYEQEVKQIKNINDSKTQEQTKLSIMSKKERDMQKRMKREEKREKERREKNRSSTTSQR